MSQSNCQCFGLLVFSLYGQGALLGRRLPVLIEIITLGCRKFAFIGSRFVSCASLGRTDDPRQRQMNHVKFDGLQKIHAGYMDGQLNTEDKVMEKYIGDFTFDDDEYLD